MRIEWVDRERERVASYLTKLGAMGFELAATSTKLGRVDERRITHYSQWEVAALAIKWGDERRGWAREKWRELFSATYATQTITFTDREALGLGEDPFESETDVPELDESAGETKEVAGIIEGETFDGIVKVQQHGILETLCVAEALGGVEHLPFVLPLPDKALDPRGWHAVWATEKNRGTLVVIHD